MASHMKRHMTLGFMHSARGTRYFSSLSSVNKKRFATRDRALFRSLMQKKIGHRFNH